MSRIDELTRDLCPNGVPVHPLSAVAAYTESRIDSGTLDSSTFVGVDNLLPNKGGKVDASYLANTDRVASFQAGDILLGNIRPYLKKIWLATHPGGLSGDVLAIRIRPSFGGRLTPEFLYYLLSSDSFFAYNMQHARGAKMPRGNKEALLKYPIPVPPLEVQHEIVRILDTFTELEAELEAEVEAELEARRLQYAHFQELLLVKDSLAPLLPLRQLLREPLANGRSVTDGEGYPVLRLTALHGPVVDTTQQKLGSWTTEAGKRFRIEAGDLLVVRGNGSKALIARGCMVEHTEEVAFPDTMIRVRPNLELISQRYLFYAWESRPARTQLERVAKLTSGVWKVSQDDLSQVVIPVPTLAEQLEVVAILDRLDALVNDLSIGLPAELAARRKQYEYYRDKLLTFEELSA